MSAILKALFFILPKNLLSSMAGSFVSIPLPKPFSNLSVWWFANKYGIDLDEAELEWKDYRCIGEFFTRRLKPEARPIADQPIIHPVDGEIVQYGPITSGQYIQAKGLVYSIAELTGDKAAREKFAGGFFVTYYLSPMDYHRVHSPVTGQIRKMKHIPGSLWPVAEWAVKSVSRLYARNERVVVDILTDWGPVAVVFVGAYNVGKISLAFEPRLTTNDGTSKPRSREYGEVPIEKGAELGTFQLGSTVVVCYPSTVVETYQNHFQLGPEVLMGNPFVIQDSIQ